MIPLKNTEDNTEINDNTTELVVPRKDTKSRKYQLTINNPLDAKVENPKGSGNFVQCPFDHDKIKDCMKQLTSVEYWCMADEIGANEETPHTHIYFVARNAIRFSTVKALFPTAHIESAYGDSMTNRDYISKQGKFAKAEKSTTSIEGTFEEFGEIPATERMGAKGELQFVYTMIEAGMTTAEILKVFPDSMMFLDKIEHTRQVLVEDEYQNTWRNLTVTYVFGKTETGKTRSVMERYGYGRVHRITDYAHPWDGYQATKHQVVAFEEFTSSLKIHAMLNYLDGYPCELVARYRNKIATYMKVYIISNIPLERQYENIQSDSPRTWEAFTRRIHSVQHFQDDGSVKIYNSIDEYNRRFFEQEKEQRAIAEKHLKDLGLL